MVRPWRFYGRQAEIDELHRFMDVAAGLGVYAIRGRRKVGKSALVGHFFAREHEADPSRPVVALNLEWSAAALHYYGDLRTRVHADMKRPDLLEGFVPADEDPVQDFVRLVEHLLKKNCTVVLDEFQRIARPAEGRAPRLPALFQGMLDRVREEPKDDGPAPRLIAMGSEQQQLMDMFEGPGEPLYQQLGRSLHVQPWNFAALSEAAADRGWDTRPDRLLTLWTAYGGMPAHWRRFAEESPELADFSVAMDDRAWTDAFLAGEEAHRHTRDGDFARQIEIEVRPGDRALLAWLAEKPKGHDLRKMPSSVMAGLADEFRRRPEAVAHAITCEEAAAQRSGRKPDPERAVGRAALREALEHRLSGAHLGLVGKRDAVDDVRARRWWVSDEHARFQLDVLEKTAREIARPGPKTEEKIAALLRQNMRQAEGPGLETLALAALERWFGPAGTAIRHGAWRRKPEAEVDMLADGGDRLWGVFAKRNPYGHDPKRDSGHVVDWLRPLASPKLKDMEKDLGGLRVMERCLLFVSPSFGDDALADLAARIDEVVRTDPGAQAVLYWYAMDIRDMLDGNAPVPLKTPKPGPPETEKEEDGGDGSGGSMSGGPGG